MGDTDDKIKERSSFEYMQLKLQQLKDFVVESTFGLPPNDKEALAVGACVATEKGQKPTGQGTVKNRHPDYYDPRSDGAFYGRQVTIPTEKGEVVITDQASIMNEGQRKSRTVEVQAPGDNGEDEIASLQLRNVPDPEIATGRAPIADGHILIDENIFAAEKGSGKSFDQAAKKNNPVAKAVDLAATCNLLRPRR
jgi:hypothetical protein